MIRTHLGKRHSEQEPEPDFIAKPGLASFLSKLPTLSSVVIIHSQSFPDGSEGGHREREGRTKVEGSRSLRQD